MEFVARGRPLTAPWFCFPQSCQSAPPSCRVLSLFTSQLLQMLPALSDQLLQLLNEKRSSRHALFRRHGLGFTQQIVIDFQCDLGLHNRVNLPSKILESLVGLLADPSPLGTWESIRQHHGSKPCPDTSHLLHRVFHQSHNDCGHGEQLLRRRAKRKEIPIIFSRPLPEALPQLQ
jgi:hypothetical protein